MNRSVILVAFVLVLVLAMVSSQRPPYAGSRPNGYKDRFRPRPTGTASSTAATLNDIDNRFGELANNLQNNINVTQRPPVGVDVVYAEPGEPNTNQQDNVPVGLNQSDQQANTVITTDNRLGSAQDPLSNNQSQSQSQQLDVASSSGLDQNNTENSTNDLLTGGSRKPSGSSNVGGFGARPTAVPLNHVPYDAHGDVFLVNLLNERPVNQQPFWFVNYQAIEAHRNGTSPMTP